ncbi:hypothetical protein [Phenylobacterium sp.]|uniref:hypothetical protein n=1 Tax=Phenylobacterium sp. TaxID=1871053 RepID=UPI00273044B3|nr:hypothetical protein [Phenylobacterium sp.]MDP2214985.1 hypothetical protein [Phenylobacterium sp.]
MVGGAYLARKLELQRLANARATVAAHLATIERQVRATAEARAIATVGGKTICFGRHSTSWRPTHERAFRAHVVHLQDVRRREVSALQAKLARQDAAIAAFRRRHGFNIDAAELLGRNLQLDSQEF